MKLCACIRENDPDDCIRMIRNTDADLVEHRIDYMLVPERLDEIYGSDIPVIATNRPLRLGGVFSGLEGARAQILINAIRSGASFVDVELEMDEDDRQRVMNAARSLGCKIIISTHFFDDTPSSEELKKVLDKMMSLGADIGKIVTMARHEKDCERVLSLIEDAKKSNFNLIAFAMGEKGRLSRPMSLIKGAPFTYCCAGKKTAPGQLDIKTMKQEVKNLKNEKTDCNRTSHKA